MISILGICECSGSWLGADCSIDGTMAPTLFQIENALCNTLYDDCNNIRISGKDFHDSDSLTCHVTPALVCFQHKFQVFLCLSSTQVKSGSFFNMNYFLLQVNATGTFTQISPITVPIVFISLSTVECQWWRLNPGSNNVSMLVSVSNNGVDKSASLLYIPHNPQCYDCDVVLGTCDVKVPTYLFVQSFKSLETFLEFF